MPAKSVQDLARVVDRVLRQLNLSSPGIRSLAGLFEVLFFATLKTEEGKPLQFRIVVINPQDPDPDKPPRPRPARWKILPLATRLPLTVPTLLKLSKAADPWNSSLAAYYDHDGTFYIWALVDQAVQFNTMLVRETESGYGLPGIFQVLAAAPADLSVHADFRFIARLQQDSILKTLSNVFWSGPISDCINVPMQRYLRRAKAKSGRIDDKEEALKRQIPFLANEWIRTLCRILISIQRYHHGGALLLTSRRAHLDIKYSFNYDRLPKALVNLGATSIKQDLARAALWNLLRDHNTQGVPVLLHTQNSLLRGEAADYAQEITGAIRFISSLSYVDGLILATPDLLIRGFGVEITSKKDPDEVYLATHPSGHKKSLRLIDPKYYGMRHRSMMRYCFGHKGSFGFVISQDGEIRAMTRVGNALLMWENLKVLDFFESEIRRKVAKRRE
jgi:hypothetical protein